MKNYSSTFIFTAWFQLNQGKEIVSAFIRSPNGQNTVVGSVIAKSGCWSMLKGGFTADENMKAELFFTVYITAFKTQNIVSFLVNFRT